MWVIYLSLICLPISSFAKNFTVWADSVLFNVLVNNQATHITKAKIFFIYYTEVTNGVDMLSCPHTMLVGNVCM